MLIKVAVKNLLRNPKRTFVTVLTVAMGTGALFLFDGFNAGIMNQYRDNTVKARFGHGQVNTVGYRDRIFEKPWEHWIENSDEVIKYVSQIPGIKYVFPRIEFFALLTNGELTVSGKGMGADGKQESEFFNTINIVQGENLSEQEDGIVLGIGLAKSLDVKPGDRVTVLGNTIYGTVNGLDLRVVGIFHIGSKDVDDVWFKIPLKKAQLLLDTQKIESIALGLDSFSAWNGVASQIESKFPQLEATHFAVLDKVYYQHAVDWLNSQFFVIQLIIIFIVILGITNTFSFTILERAQEIGNLRANGESKFDVLRLLAYEGIALGLVGSLVGIVVGYVINTLVLPNGILMPPAPGITRQYHVWIELQPGMIFIASLIGTISAFLSTLFAGFKVAFMPIGKALRSL